LRRRFFPISIFSYKATLDARELAGLHPSLPRLLGNGSAELTARKYEGPLSFRKDVWIPLGYLSTQYLAERVLKAAAQGDSDSMEFLIDVPFAFQRQRVLSDKSAVAKELIDVFKKEIRAPFQVVGSVSYSGAVWRPFHNDFINKNLAGKRWEFFILQSNDKKIAFFASQSRNHGAWKLVDGP
jgi:hypothetical protein